MNLKKIGLNSLISLKNAVKSSPRTIKKPREKDAKTRVDVCMKYVYGFESYLNDFQKQRLEIILEELDLNLEYDIELNLYIIPLFTRMIIKKINETDPNDLISKEISQDYYLDADLDHIIKIIENILAQTETTRNGIYKINNLIF